MSIVPTAVDLLCQLVACPSVNPGAKDTLGPNEGEARMVDRLRDILRPWADDITIQEVAHGRPNLIARFDGISSNKGYALEAHTDTVGVGGMTVPPFDAQITEGKLFGRGACDTKGPMAAMLHALIHTKAKLGQFPTSWYFVATCDEELGGKGARHLIDSGFRVDGIIVGEPTELKRIDAHKGVARFLLKVKGRAAHSAYPEQGSHAIHAAGAFISSVETLIYSKTDSAVARYTTNAGFYSEANIPAVVWGPGSVKQAHTADEWIAVQQVEQASDVLCQLIETSV